jgi:hypothetical protein
MLQAAHAVPDQVTALVGINESMKKVTQEMERLAVSAGMVHHHLDKDFTEDLVHLHFLMSSLMEPLREHPGFGSAGPHRAIEEETTEEKQQSKLYTLTTVGLQKFNDALTTVARSLGKAFAREPEAPAALAPHERTIAAPTLERPKAAEVYNLAPENTAPSRPAQARASKPARVQAYALKFENDALPLAEDTRSEPEVIRPAESATPTPRRPRQLYADEQLALDRQAATYPLAPPPDSLKTRRRRVRPPQPEKVQSYETIGFAPEPPLPLADEKPARPRMPDVYRLARPQPTPAEEQERPQAHSPRLLKVYRLAEEVEKERRVRQPERTRAARVKQPVPEKAKAPTQKADAEKRAAPRSQSIGMIGAPAEKLMGPLTQAGEGVKEFTKSLDKASKEIVRTGGFFAANSLRAASPDAFATLTGSFKLLAAQLGTTLVPHAAKASVFIQGLANQFRQMDDGTKRLVGSTAAWGLAGAAVIAITPRLLAAASALGSIGKGAGGLLAGGAKLAMSHPLAAGAAVVAATAIGGGMYLDRRANQYKEDEQKAEEEFQSGVAQRGRGEVEAGLKREYGSLAKEDQRKNVASDLEAAKQQEQQALRSYKRHRGLDQDIDINHTTGGMDYLGKWATGLWNRTSKSGREEGKQRLQAYEQARAKRVELEQYRDVLGGNFKDPEKLKGARNDALVAYNSALMDYQNRVQPAYYGVEDMGKKIQLDALSESPLQQEIRRIQLEQLEELQKIFQELNSKMGKETPVLAR